MVANAFWVAILALAPDLVTASSQHGRVCRRRPCQASTVTSTYEQCATTTISSMSGQTSCPTTAPACSSTTTIAGSASTTTTTITPPISTFTDIVITPIPSTTTITLSTPITSAITLPTSSTSIVILSKRGEACIGTTVTSVTTVTRTDYTSTVWAVQPPSSCPEVSAPLCTTTLAPVTSTATATASASSTHITTTLLPITVTATLNPTTSFNVLRATGVKSVSSDPTDVAVASSNNMYANLIYIPGSSDGSYAVTFNINTTTPENASHFTYDPTTQQLLGTGNGATAYVANTEYDYRSDYVFFSNDPDPVGSTGSSYPALICTVDATTKAVTCLSGSPTKLKNQFSICGADPTVDRDFPQGYDNVNGNLFITVDPVNQDCAAATLLLEEVVLYQLIPPPRLPLLPRMGV